jgi:hypothetical protein
MNRELIPRGQVKTDTDVSVMAPPAILDESQASAPDWITTARRKLGRHS